MPLNARSKSLVKGVLLVLGASLVLAAFFAYGVVSARRRNRPYNVVAYLIHQKEALFPRPEPTARAGAWAKARTANAAPDQGLSEAERDSLGQLGALPYLQGYKSAPASANVTIYDKEKAYDGLNFIVSADAPTATLMDMKGNVLHKWRKDFGAVWPANRPPPYPRSEIHKTYWRRAQLLDNGDVLAMFMDYGLIKLDKDSNLLWTYDGGAHHDLFTHHDGNIYLLTRDRRERADLGLESWRFNPNVWEDAITILSPDGKEIRRISVLDCLLQSAYAPLLEHTRVWPDILHTNSLKPILVDRPPLFKKGQLLVSLRDIHTIAVIDPEKQKVIWAVTGLWKYQHEPWPLKNGNVLLFDNRGNRGKSQAIEFNPVTQEVVWSYRAEPIQSFYSREAGAIQRLPNGNTLITESEGGRGFEVTPEGRIVWEFLNPQRAGEKKELIAALYDVTRVESGAADWLPREARKN